MLYRARYRSKANRPRRRATPGQDAAHIDLNHFSKHFKFLIMANFDVSNLLTAQTMVNAIYENPEMRMKPAPAFGLLTSNDALIMGAETLRTREDRAIEAHLLTRTKRSSGSSRTHNHTGTIDDSQKVTLNWTTKSDKFAISLKLLDKSVFDFNTVLANKMVQACMNVLEDKETETIAYLRAQRATQQPSGLKGGTFTAATNAIDIDATNAIVFYQRLKSVMRQNYFGGQIDVIADSNMQVAAERLAAQGAGNATNTAFQFAGLRIVESIELNDANYADGIVLAMPSQSASALNWIPQQNRNGYGDYNSFVGGYGTFSFGGYTFAVHGYAQRADTSASNGNSQDVSLEFEVSLDTSYNKAPLSFTTGRTDSVILQFGQTS